jgi:U6 snRNA-associated Sm-like protein LSm3
MVETFEAIDNTIKQPFDLLALLLQEQVFVKLRHGRSMTGVLVAYDEHLNLMLNDAIESVRDADGTIDTNQLQIVYVRGDLVVAVAPHNV